MSEFKYGIYTVQDPYDPEKQAFAYGLKNMDDWEDLKILIEPCLQKIYNECKGSQNDAFKMLTWEFQQYLANKILEVRPPCLIVEAKIESIADLIRIKTVRAIEDATRRIEIKEIFRCDRYIREEEKKRNDIK